MQTIGDAPTLLELLREAGDEAVTFDELELVGISDPARALWELELDGFTVHRLFDERKLCVRLGTEPPRRFHFEDAETEEHEAVLAGPVVADTRAMPATPRAETPPAMPRAAGSPAPSAVVAFPAKPALLALAAFLLMVLFARRAR